MTLRHTRAPDISSERQALNIPGPGPLESDLTLLSVDPTHSGEKIKTLIPERHILRDPNQRVLVLSEEVLLALEDKKSITGASQTANPDTMARNQIFLAVSEGKLCLYCAKEPTCPSLQLKEMDITQLNSLMEETRLPYTFIRKDIGSYFTLESAANPGYFIYTSNIPRQPVGVTMDIGNENNIYFQFGDLYVNLRVRETDYTN
ncbi:PREDICTED: interleukin-37-like [Condylura cristata]|uniref:interleukin-37-like n=1 Tax=Condylura cristata TaxID=143302 RepID=UPI00064382FB|nr:PREDICTED: interleukin-37-like [Condylura cristata]